MQSRQMDVVLYLLLLLHSQQNPLTTGSIWALYLLLTPHLCFIACATDSICINAGTPFVVSLLLCSLTVVLVTRVSIARNMCQHTMCYMACYDLPNFLDFSSVDRNTRTLFKKHSLNSTMLILWSIKSSQIVTENS